ncbi:acetyl-coenzyme A synthetase N-terminal domain-containing protein, partial [Kocuria rhizophila]
MPAPAPRPEDAMSQPTYESVYRASVDDPERFWLDAADAVEWI